MEQFGEEWPQTRRIDLFTIHLAEKSYLEKLNNEKSSTQSINELVKGAGRVSKDEKQMINKHEKARPCLTKTINKSGRSNGLKSEQIQHLEIGSCQSLPSPTHPSRKY